MKTPQPPQAVKSVTTLTGLSDDVIVPPLSVDGELHKTHKSGTASAIKLVSHPVSNAIGAVHRLSAGKKISSDSNNFPSLKSSSSTSSSIANLASAMAGNAKAPVVATESLVRSLKCVLGGCDKKKNGKLPSENVSIGNIELSHMDDLDPNQIDLIPIIMQLEWNAFSKWLQKFSLKSFKLPEELDLTANGGCPPCTAWGEGKSKTFSKIVVKKRFNSRKLPHLLELENSDGDKNLYIFKQDDDITMDVVVVNLFRECNKIWERRGIDNRLYTYKVVACPDKTGFGEIVPGDTMSNFHAKDIDAALGTCEADWKKFVLSMAGVAVATAIFDISDRHHNNVLFTPTGEVCLIDLSASLGKKAPLDAGLVINPVYLPNRFLSLREYSNVLRQKEWGGRPKSFTHFEEMCIIAYYAIYNDYNMKAAMKEVGYSMIKPHKFLNLLHERKNTRQAKEGLRNDIVKAMDNSDSFNKFVAGITSVLPMN
eukprot:CFRG5352T1